MLKGYFILQCSVHVWKKFSAFFSGAVNMVKFGYPYLTSVKAVFKYILESTIFQFTRRASKH